MYLPSVTKQNNHNILDCISHAILFIPVTYFLDNWKFAPLEALHLFHTPPSNYLFILWVYESVSVLSPQTS